MTDPKKRLTATDALSHPFVQFQPATFKLFSARRRFKVSDVLNSCNCFFLLAYDPGPFIISLYPMITPHPAVFETLVARQQPTRYFISLLCTHVKHKHYTCIVYHVSLSLVHVHTCKHYVLCHLQLCTHCRDSCTASGVVLRLRRCAELQRLLP